MVERQQIALTCMAAAVCVREHVRMHACVRDVLPYTIIIFDPG